MPSRSRRRGFASMRHSPFLHLTAYPCRALVESRICQRINRDIRQFCSDSRLHKHRTSAVNLQLGSGNVDSRPNNDDLQRLAAEIRAAAKDASLRLHRTELATLATDVFSRVGQELHVLGHIVGADRQSGQSPFGHGTDETVGVSLLFRIAAQLSSAAMELFAGGHNYAAAALLRQIVEIEYLAWAFETRDRDAERWLRSDRKERERFFSPRKLRDAANDRFRGKDYGYHCELGGHPVPTAPMLLAENSDLPQLLIADLLGHLGRIWDHLVGWARNSSHGDPILQWHSRMLDRFTAWKSLDPLSALPPPP